MSTDGHNFWFIWNGLQKKELKVGCKYNVQSVKVKKRRENFMKFCNNLRLMISVIGRCKERVESFFAFTQF